MAALSESPQCSPPVVLDTSGSNTPLVEDSSIRREDSSLNQESVSETEPAKLHKEQSEMPLIPLPRRSFHDKPGANKASGVVLEPDAGDCESVEQIKVAGGAEIKHVDRGAQTEESGEVAFLPSDHGRVEAEAGASRTREYADDIPVKIFHCTDYSQSQFGESQDTFVRRGEDLVNVQQFVGTCKFILIDGRIESIPRDLPWSYLRSNITTVDGREVAMIDVYELAAPKHHLVILAVILFFYVGFWVAASVGQILAPQVGLKIFCVILAGFLAMLFPVLLIGGFLASPFTLLEESTPESFPITYSNQ